MLLIIITAYLLLIPISIVVFRRAERASAHVQLSVQDRASGRVDYMPAGLAAAERDGSTGAAVEMRKEQAEAVAEMTRAASVDQRRRFIAACVIVLITFAARAAFDFLNIYSTFNDPYNPACGNCDPCQSDQFLIQTWLNFTPEFQPIVVALSSPLPLAISLWLMMSKEERTFLRFPGLNDQTYQTPEQKMAVAARARMGVVL